jgi:uncharacterized protein YggE
MFKNLFFAIGTITVLVAIATYLPIDKINWGRVSILPAATITVTGEAQSNVVNQKASFSATISVTNADKQTAVNKVNQEMTDLIKALKNFGIADADITTQQVSVYQMPTVQPQTLIYPAPPVPASSGDWQASNTITINLNDVSKATDVSDILNKSGATNVYGPNLSAGNNTAQTDADLLSEAVANARKKAESIAKSGNQTVGKMINVQENGGNYPMPLFATKDSSGGVGTPIQPGTTTLSKSVTVIFELK